MMDWISERMIYTKKACSIVSKSLEGEKVSVCFPLEYKTAFLIGELSKFLKLKVSRFDEATTKEEAVKWLEKRRIRIEREEECLDSTYFLDCVAVLTRMASKRGKCVEGVVELTRSGVERLREIENFGVFKRAISIDDSNIKGVGENVYGTGLGLLDALLRLNIQLPGKRVYIIGFGRVGQGCASLLKKIGCEVEVFDRNSIKNSLASSMGFRVSDLEEGLSRADIVITATGARGVINSSNAQLIRNGAIVCNMGAGEHEVDLRELNYEKKHLGPVSKFSGRNHFYVLANGKPATLAVGNGTPIEIMDKTFALVVFALDYIVNRDFSGIMGTPEEIELKVAKLIEF
jgi:adenosylhomocysteinase